MVAIESSHRVGNLDLTDCEGDREGIRITLDLVHTVTGEHSPVILDTPALYCRNDRPDARMIERVTTYLQIPGG